MALQHLRSNTASKRPTPGSMSDGQLAINTNATSPGVFFKDAGGALIKVGPVHIGTSAPNSSPAVGGQTGNSIGEQWLDTSGGGYVFKVWDGTAWRSETGQFVDVAGDTMTGDLTISGADLIMSNGEIIAAAGAEATPSITFTGDTNTGIYSPGADQVAISTGGTQRLQIDSSGNVGIGTSNPQNILHVNNASSSACRLYLQNINSSSASSTQIWSQNNDIVLNAGDAERFRIDSSGRVGIGTSSPDTELHVASTSPVLRFENPTTASTLGTSMGKIEWETRDLSAPGVIGYIDVVDSNNFGSAFDMHLATGITGAATTKVTIKADGKVGIGTASPAEKLHVAGKLLLNNGSSSYFDAASSNGLNITNPTAVRFEINSGERMRIDSSGNVGIGTSSPARNLHVSGSGSVYTLVTNTGTGPSNAFLGASTSQIQLIARDATTNAVPTVFINGTTETMRIDSSGRLLVGTSTAPTAGSWARHARLVSNGNAADATGTGILNLAPGKAATSIASGNGIGVISFSDNGGNEFGLISCLADAAAGLGDYPGRLVFSTTSDGASSPSERMRIDSLGRVKIGTQGNIYTVGGIIQVESSSWNFVSRRSVSSSAGHIIFENSNGQVGSITTNGTATSYNTSSDYRLKENVTAVTDGITRLQQLKPSRFNFIADPDTIVDGFIAHEVQTIVPEAITGEKDAVDDDGNPEYQGIDQSKLVPLLTAALQEAIAKIETLEQRLTDAGL